MIFERECLCSLNAIGFLAALNQVIELSGTLLGRGSQERSQFGKLHNPAGNPVQPKSCEIDTDQDQA